MISGLVWASSMASFTPYDIFVWQNLDPNFGGFSGVAISSDETGFTAISDWRLLFEGTMVCSYTIHLMGIKALPSGWVAMAPAIGTDSDLEGLAIAKDGRASISDEKL